MKKAEVYVSNILAGFLVEADSHYYFDYLDEYAGQPVSLTMPVHGKKFSFDSFPPFFDGLLPEGQQLEGLLRQHKIDRNDYFNQLLAVGNDMVGNVTVKSTV